MIRTASRINFAFLISLGSLLSGCNKDLAETNHQIDPGLACTEMAVSGITIWLIDADGNPVKGAKVTIKDGEYEEVLESYDIDENYFSGAVERAGNFSAIVEAQGFYSLVLEDLKVTSGLCHVNPVQREVTLEKK